MPARTSVTARLLTVTLPVFSTVIVYVTVSPALTPLVLSAAFVTLIAGAASTVVTFSESLPVTSTFLGSLPFTVAVLLISPASTSVCLTTYVAVAVAFSLGAIVVLSSVPSWMSLRGSVNTRLLTVTLPLFSTVIVYVTVSPALTPLVLSAVLVTTRFGVPVSVVTFSESLPVTSTFLGSLPFTVAVLLISPASTSVCLTTYVAVAVAFSLGAIVVLSSVPSWMSLRGSVSTRLFTVALPVFSTVIVYVTVSPALTPLVLSAVFVTFRLAAISAVLTVASAVFVRLSPIAAVTVFLKLPAAISAAVILYVAVVSTVSPAATFSNTAFVSVTSAISDNVIVLASE